MDEKEKENIPEEPTLGHAAPGELFRLHRHLSWKYIRGFATLIVVGLILGVIGGLVGTAFCYALRFAANTRAGNPWLVYLLPLGGLAIVWLYSQKGLRPTDTNGVLLAIHTPSRVPFATAPLIFISTAITHLLGGSAGREGAALQLGGVLGYHFGKLCKLNERDSHLVVMAGMSAVFAALFGAPLTAAIFAIEVASVGILHFSGIVPCLTASLTANYIANALGASAESFPLSDISAFTFSQIGSVMLIAAVCAVISIVFCVSLKHMHYFAAKKIPDPYWRVFIAGCAVVLLTVILGTNDYNGAGMDVISRAMDGVARPEAFLWKLLFTVITMSCGYKGGEIVPAMFIGATLGCTLGNLLGLAPGLGAAVGLVCMFCGSLNCPISAIFLGVELFGAANLYFFAIAAAISYMLSANFGLYREQKIVYSKIKPKFINRYTD